MTSPILAPCLWLDAEAETAAAFYLDTFGSGRIIARTLFPSSLDNPVGKPKGSVMSVEFEVCDLRLTTVNGGDRFTINPSISLMVHVASPDEATRLFTALSSGGETLMPLDAYPWSPRYGWAADRFGVSWQVMTVAEGGATPTIAPALMFCNDQFGDALPAMEHWCSIFPDARIVDIERFGPGEPAPDAVKQGSFMLAGRRFVAMDSPGKHAFGFNEAVSLQVLCAGQEDVDRYWRELCRDGAPSQSGWLKDRFGVSWQVVPEQWLAWLGTDSDEAARERVFKAMTPMTKIDVAALERAFAGD